MSRVALDDRRRGRASAIRVGGGVILAGDLDDLTALASGLPEVLIEPL